jgi:hypothetical protein
VRAAARRSTGPPVPKPGNARPQCRRVRREAWSSRPRRRHLRPAYGASQYWIVVQSPVVHVPAAADALPGWARNAEDLSVSSGPTRPARDCRPAGFPRATVVGSATRPAA